MPEADKLILLPHPEDNEERSKRWILLLTAGDEGIHWTFDNRDHVEMWLRMALGALQDG